MCWRTACVWKSTQTTNDLAFRRRAGGARHYIVECGDTLDHCHVITAAPVISALEDEEWEEVRIPHACCLFTAPLPHKPSSASGCRRSRRRYLPAWNPCAFR